MQQMWIMFSTIMRQKRLLIFTSFLVVIWVIFVISQNSAKVGTCSPTLTRSCTLRILHPISHSNSVSFSLIDLWWGRGIVSTSSLPVHPQSLIIKLLPLTGTPNALLRPPTAISLNKCLSLSLDAYLLDYLIQPAPTFAISNQCALQFLDIKQWLEKAYHWKFI